MFTTPLLAAAASAVLIKHKPDADHIFSCSVPLPYLANGTQATSWEQYLNENPTDPDSEGQGAADHFAGSVGKAPLKWPRNSENKAVIPYCYYDKKDREKLHEIIESGIAKWMTYIGPPGKESGQAIVFEERSDGKGHPVYCHGESKDKIEEWNSDLPHETVAIFTGDATGWKASVGLNPDQTKPWQNVLIGPDTDEFFNFEAMHELGHVMGMAHEHQRDDREQYIVVKPEKISDFEECYQRAHQKDPKATRDNVCNHLRYALASDCHCVQWMKGMTGLYLPLFTFGTYDIDSIMHYGSAHGSTSKCAHYSGEGDMSECPIQVYQNFDDHSQGLTKMTPNLHPSAQDIRWVQSVYSWDGSGKAPDAKESWSASASEATPT